MNTRTALHEIRERRGVSAAQLAKLTGASRQTIYAIEAGDYVPNTALALHLARILEVRVEDLFQLESESVAPLPPIPVELLTASEGARKGQPVQVCRVGKRMLGVSASTQSLGLPLADGVVVSASSRQARVQMFPGESENEGKRLLIAGCDPGMSLLSHHLARFHDIDLVVAASNSQQALEWLKQDKVHVAGTHLRDTSSGEYNLPIVNRLFKRGAVTVVTFAVWEQGLVIDSANRKNISGVEDLARKEVRIINREKGAGSRALLDNRLRQAGIAPNRVNGYDRIAGGHLGAALAVSSGDADCCIATRSAAWAFGLAFIPLATERYDLVIRRPYVRMPAMQALLDLLSRSAIRKKLETLAGYDTSHTGEVLVA